MIIIMCVFNQFGKYHVKDMNVYIDPIINELLNLWVGITIYDVSRPIGQKEFQFHGILVWTIHDAPRLRNFYGK